MQSNTNTLNLGVGDFHLNVVHIFTESWTACLFFSTSLKFCQYQHNMWTTKGLNDYIHMFPTEHHSTYPAIFCSRLLRLHSSWSTWLRVNLWEQRITPRLPFSFHVLSSALSITWYHWKCILIINEHWFLTEVKTPSESYFVLTFLPSRLWGLVSRTVRTQFGSLNFTKPKPLDWFVLLSFMMTQSTTSPYWEK